MAKKNAPKKKEQDTPPMPPDIDMMAILQRYKSKIITAVCVIIIIALAIVFYNDHRESTENESWSLLSDFLRAEFDEAKTQELINKLSGTSAEPWALYYCSILYFTNNNLEKAQEMVDRIKSEYGDHYICANKLFYETAKDFIYKESQWLKENPPAPKS